MIPRHKVFHIVLFVLALNFLIGCPTAHALTPDTLQLSCSVSSSVDLKKKYSQSQYGQESSPTFFLSSQHTAFFLPASNRLCMQAAFFLVNCPAPFETSMRLNL
jgi:hypothetical protein